MEKTRLENLQKALLLIVAIGLIPIALSYGLMPVESLDYLYNIQVSDTNVIHIMRAVMGLYLSLIIFWLMGVFKPHIRKAALYSLIVFMFGLAAGRILSLIMEGIPNWILLIYLFLEIGFGFLGLVLVRKSE